MTKVFKYISAIFSLLLAIPMVLPQTVMQMTKDISEQSMRIEYLENQYKSGLAAKCDESKITDFDLKTALDNGVKYNEMRFIATHNSYQKQSVDSVKQCYNAVSQFTSSVIYGKGDFESKTLTDQLNLGIRGLELDVEPKRNLNGVSFVCSHAPFIDMTTTCYDLSLALKEIKMWSDYNPGHLPVTIIIEPKQFYLPLNGIRFFNLNYANCLDKVLRDSLGDTLLEPSDMLRGYKSFKEMRNANDWMKLSDMLGKVVVLLHPGDVCDEYLNQDKTVRSQAMFPALRYEDRNESYASIIFNNNTDSALLNSREYSENLKVVVRTYVDSFADYSYKSRENALKSTANMLSTDYPVTYPTDGYVCGFGENFVKTVSLNVKDN